jgi:hypothetical protein
MLMILWHQIEFLEVVEVRSSMGIQRIHPRDGAFDSPAIRSLDIQDGTHLPKEPEDGTIIPIEAS